MRPETLSKLAGALALLVAATAFAWLTNRPPAPATLAKEGIAAKVDRVAIDHPQGSIELAKGASGWTGSKPKGYPADGRTIDEILERLPKTRVSEPLTEDPERYAMFGFSASSATRVRLYAGQSAVLDFYVGKAGTDYPSAFVRLAKQTGVVQVLGMAPTDWVRAPGDWLDRKISGGMAEGVTALSVKGPKGSWELKQSSGGWTLGGKPVPPENVERLVRQAREAAGQLEADSVLEAAAAPQDAGLDKPELTIRAELKTGPLTLMVGKEDSSKRRYVRKQGEDRVMFLVADWKLDALRKPAAEFLKKP